MPQTELLARLDELINQAEPFSEIFFRLHQLRTEIKTACAVEEANQAIEEEYRLFCQEQEHRELAYGRY